MTEWKVTKRAPACTTCERTFEDGEAHVSALTIAEESITREDACLACWKKHPGAHERIWWRTRRDCAKKPGISLNLAALEALFVRLEGRAETALRELRYVVCLVLMRKRRLKIERVARDERGEGLIVTRPRHTDSFFVAVFDFTPQKIDELRARLQEVFEGAEGDAAALTADGESQTQTGDSEDAD